MDRGKNEYNVYVWWMYKHNVTYTEWTVCHGSKRINEWMKCIRNGTRNESKRMNEQNEWKMDHGTTVRTRMNEWNEESAGYFGSEWMNEWIKWTNGRYKKERMNGMNKKWIMVQNEWRWQIDCCMEMNEWMKHINRNMEYNECIKKWKPTDKTTKLNEQMNGKVYSGIKVSGCPLNETEYMNKVNEEMYHSVSFDKKWMSRAMTMNAWNEYEWNTGWW